MTLSPIFLLTKQLLVLQRSLVDREAKHGKKWGKWWLKAILWTYEIDLLTFSRFSNDGLASRARFTRPGLIDRPDSEFIFQPFVQIVGPAFAFGRVNVSCLHPAGTSLWNTYWIRCERERVTQNLKEILTHVLISWLICCVVCKRNLQCCGCNGFEFSR